jgi:hypothetical protein
MKGNKLNWIAFALLTFINLSFYQKENEIIWWGDHYQLKWEDFKKISVPINANSLAGAASMVGVDRHIEIYRDTFFCEFKTFFKKKESWLRKNEKTEAGLKHEQGHFDICEIYARQIRKAISEGKFKKNKMEKDCNKLYDSIIVDMWKCQNNYDDETKHHRDQEKQKEWDVLIQGELQELETYKNVKVIVTPIDK